MKKVVYTAIFGDKDDLKEIPISESFDYLVFTDNSELKSDQFKVELCFPRFNDPTRNARYIKVNAHKVLPDYACSLWIDANIDFKGLEVGALFDRYLENHDIALHAHPVRDCIYDEGHVCLKTGKDNPATIQQQMKRYRSKNYPKNNGLVSTSIMFRRHTPKIAQLNRDWWQEISNNSRRDQLSYNYVAYKNQIEHFIIDGHVRTKNVTGFNIYHHKKGEYKNW